MCSLPEHGIAIPNTVQPPLVCLACSLQHPACTWRPAHHPSLVPLQALLDALPLYLQLCEIILKLLFALLVVLDFYDEDAGKLSRSTSSLTEARSHDAPVSRRLICLFSISAAPEMLVVFWCNLWTFAALVTALLLIVSMRLIGTRYRPSPTGLAELQVHQSHGAAVMMSSCHPVPHAAAGVGAAGPPMAWHRATAEGIRSSQPL